MPLGETRLLFHLTRLVSWLICRFYFRISFRGVEHVPSKGPVILAPNHASFLDPIWISLPVSRPMRYMTWERFVYMPFLGGLIRIFGGFPVRLESGDRAALRAASQQLHAGGPLVIFPEGGRTRTGKIMPFKPGFIRLALETNAPILPVTIIGGYEAYPPSLRFPRPRKVEVIYHLPIYLQEPDESCESREYLHQQCVRIRQIVASELPASEQTSQLPIEQ
jgi:1-acyl-sn-glycerol-3-phosphate acyltransferase